jgi:hypothetical protein
LNSSYNISFFYNFSKTLYANWFSAYLVSDSNMIKNDKKGKILDIFNKTSAVTKHLPIIGPSLELFGKTLEAIDKEK